MPLTDSDIIETSNHIHHVLDKLVYMRVKSGPPSIEAIQESIDVLMGLKNNWGELYIIFDPRDGIALNRIQRKYATSKFDEFVDGVVMINNNPFVKFIFTLVIKFDNPKYELTVCDSKEEGEKWIEALKKRKQKKVI